MRALDKDFRSHHGCLRTQKLKILFLTIVSGWVSKTKYRDAGREENNPSRGTISNK